MFSDLLVVRDKGCFLRSNGEPLWGSLFAVPAGKRGRKGILVY